MVVSLGTCQEQIQRLLKESTFILVFELCLQIFVPKFNVQHTVEENQAQETSALPG